jgi:hypothetical protein
VSARVLKDFGEALRGLGPSAWLMLCARVRTLALASLSPTVALLHSSKAVRALGEIPPLLKRRSAEVLDVFGDSPAARFVSLRRTEGLNICFFASTNAIFLARQLSSRSLAGAASGRSNSSMRLTSVSPLSCAISTGLSRLTASEVSVIASQQRRARNEIASRLRGGVSTRLCSGSLLPGPPRSIRAPGYASNSRRTTRKSTGSLPRAIVRGSLKCASRTAAPV